MELFDSEIKRAAEICLCTGVPFCLYRMPGEMSEIIFFSNPSFCSKNQGGVHTDGFLICEWKKKSSDSIIIEKELDASETVRTLNGKTGCLHEPLTAPCDSSTCKDSYLESLERLIETIKTEQLGKVVVSRTYVKKLRRDARFYIDFAEKLFSSYPNSFRFLYFTPLTGAWAGASPELILDYDSSTGCAFTMALAGTRSAESNSEGNPWSTKDVLEQQIVTDFIVKELSDAGFTVKCSDPQTMTTGKLQHIATYVDAKYEGACKPSIENVLDIINPTPALCGYPRKRAAELIEESERHERHCYGGVVGTVSGNELKAYVNLRCVNFNEERLCIYGGGGILSDSNPESEWEEASGKIDAIRGILLDSYVTD